MAIRFLGRIPEWKDFSNLASYLIILDGEVWKSAEHYFQFRKFEQSDPEYALRIKEGFTPREEELIEANPDDYFLGEGKDGSGQNMMGKILMEMRAYLRSKEMVLTLCKVLS